MHPGDEGPLVAEGANRPGVSSLERSFPLAKRESGLGLGTTISPQCSSARRRSDSRRSGTSVWRSSPIPLPRETPVGFPWTLALSLARAVTNAFEVVGELNGRLAPFLGTESPPGTESSRRSNN